jgi:hypothetical protein
LRGVKPRIARKSNRVRLDAKIQTSYLNLKPPGILN